MPIALSFINIRRHCNRSKLQELAPKHALESRRRLFLTVDLRLHSPPHLDLAFYFLHHTGAAPPRLKRQAMTLVMNHTSSSLDPQSRPRTPVY